jgi:hypothetical protein
LQLFAAEIRLSCPLKDYIGQLFFGALDSAVQLLQNADQRLGGVFNNPFGSGIVGTYDINAFDSLIQGWMEVGDPLEGESNYGGYPYTLGGFTYNLQSLVLIGYFRGPKSDSVNSWLSFQNDEKNVCPGQ